MLILVNSFNMNGDLLKKLQWKDFKEYSPKIICKQKLLNQ